MKKEELKVGDIVKYSTYEGKILAIFDDIGYDPYTFAPFTRKSAAVHYNKGRCTFTVALDKLTLKEDKIQIGDKFTINNSDTEYRVSRIVEGYSRTHYICIYETSYDGIAYETYSDIDEEVILRSLKK